jgi:hypothetical protein
MNAQTQLNVLLQLEAETKSNYQEQMSGLRQLINAARREAKREERASRG